MNVKSMTQTQNSTPKSDFTFRWIAFTIYRTNWWNRTFSSVYCHESTSLSVTRISIKSIWVWVSWIDKWRRKTKKKKFAVKPNRRDWQTTLSPSTSCPTIRSVNWALNVFERKFKRRSVQFGNVHERFARATECTHTQSHASNEQSAVCVCECVCRRLSENEHFSKNKMSLRIV